MQLTIVTSDKDVAAKVAAYLQTTKAQGTLSATPTFSDSRRKELESQARTKAIEDAKAKANQTANELGGKVGKVQAIGESGGLITPYATRGMDSVAGSTSAVAPDVSSSYTSATLQTGQQEVSMSISVTFALN